MLLKKDGKRATAAEYQTVAGGLTVADGGRLLALLDAGPSSPLSLVKKPDGVNLAGKLAAGQSRPG